MSFQTRFSLEFAMLNARNKLFLLVVLLSLMFATGCGNDPRMSRLAGTWTLNLQSSDEFVDNLLDGQLPEDANMMQKLAFNAAKAVAKDKINSIAKKAEEFTGSSMTLTFKADGTWSSQTKFSNAGGEKQGLWKVVKEDGDDLEISCHWTDPKSGKTDNVRTTVHFVSAEQIKLVPPNMSGTEMELTFDRQPAK